MQVTVEKTGPCQAKIQFTVPSSEFQAAYRRQIQTLGQNAQMKGFRPGKVPPQVIEKQFGQQVRNDAIEHFVRQAYEQAVGEQKLKIVGFQRVNLDEVKILDGVDWQHQFEVSLRPDIALQNYKGVEIESELEQVMDAEIDNALDQLKVQQSRPEPAGDAGVPVDGMVTAKIAWIVGDATVLERDGLRIGPSTATPGVEAEAFKTALTGAKDGDVVDIEMTVPAEFENPEVRGQKGVTRVTVAQAFRMIPPSEADVRRMFGVEDDAQLRAVVREKLTEAKAERENQRIEGAILEKLLAAHTIELPSMMVDEQARSRLEQLGQQMQQQGAAVEKIKEHLETQRGAAREAAEKGLRALFLVQAIGEAETQLVTREDMEAELAQIAARNKANVEEVREYYKQNKLFDQMAIEILERKVRRFLREEARITTPS